MSFPLRPVSGLILAAALAATPLAYGGTRPAGTWLLVALVGAAVLCRSAELFRERRLPWSPLFLLVGLGALFFAAVPWLCQLTEPTPIAEFSRTHFARVLARWPHSVLRNDMATSVALHASLGLALWLVADLSRERRWAIAFSAVLVATAVIATLLALMENHLPLSWNYWAREPTPPGFHWGPFFHHTSAGAYLNTAWPLAAGLAALSWRTFPTGRLRLAAGLASFFALLLLCGAHSSHISRFPQIAALIVMPFLLFKLKSLFVPVPRLAIAALAGGVVLLALWFGRMEEIARRWRLLDLAPSQTVLTAPPESQWRRLVREDLLIPNRYNAGFFGDRGEAQRTAWRAIVARPLTGHGPGNWLGAASRYCLDPYVRTFYLYLQFAHEDFLQTWVEWGLPGFLSLLFLLGGGLFAMTRGQKPTDPAKNLICFTAALGLTAVLLQSLLDFPLQIPAVALNAHVLAGLCWGGATPTQSHPSLA